MRWFLLSLLPQILLAIANVWGATILGVSLGKRMIKRLKSYRELKGFCEEHVACVVTYVKWDSGDAVVRMVYRNTVSKLTAEEANEKYLRDKYPAAEGWVSHYAYRSGEAPADQEWPSEVEVGDGLAH